ncbi:helix-turn-helix domain-containing protein [Nocardia sp. NBC_00881]|uniref:helix-turn-helix domain-containing protein n=1 Tax=Nocardia sp. NBC_00881 TaxID=2975995 RepID=UPI003864A3E2|nr:helix-turn-helix domain-containing protein [Nocardia sp. NBC_00881]
MRRNPANRPSDHFKSGPAVRIPKLSSTCRSIREDLGLSRAEARDRTGLSDGYLFEIERGKHVPSLEALEKLIAGYRLNLMQARHLRELRAPAEDLLPTPKLRESLTANDVLMSHLQGLEQRGVLGAYIDPVWNVLACNDSCRAALPGLEETAESIPAWLYSPTAKTIVIEWEREAAHAAAVLKAMFGRYRASEQVRDLMRRLRPNRDTNRLWGPSTNVAYSRDASNPLHWRHPSTGQPNSYIMTASEVNQTQNVLLVTALRRPYCGPTIV